VNSAQNNNSVNLNNAMSCLESFYKSAALLFQSAKDILINEYGYVEIRDSRLSYSFSTSIRNPNGWLPNSLCIYLKEKNSDDYIALLTILKEPFSLDKKPVEDFYLYGFKIFNEKRWKTINRICRIAIFNPGQNKGTSQNKNGFIEVTFQEQTTKCKMTKCDLWAIDNINKLRDFISETINL